MASENKINDATSFQQSDKTILCANGCGFFGEAATMDLCSKCYRDRRLKEVQTASVKAAVEKSMTSKSPAPVTLVVKKKSVEAAASPSTVVDPTSQPPPPKRAIRCHSCNKKVGFIGFKCKCSRMFCGSHRYPEAHECDVDYKSAGKDAIAKANPLVKADKIVRF